MRTQAGQDGRQLNPWQLGEEHQRRGVPSSKCPYGEGSIERRRYMGGRQNVINQASQVKQSQWAQGGLRESAAD